MYLYNVHVCVQYGSLHNYVSYTYLFCLIKKQSTVYIYIHVYTWICANGCCEVDEVVTYKCFLPSPRVCFSPYQSCWHWAQPLKHRAVGPPHLPSSTTYNDC